MPERRRLARSTLASAFWKSPAGFVNGREIDECLREVGRVHLPFGKTLADGQRTLMHVLSAIHVELAVVEDAEIVINGGDAGALISIEFLEGLECLLM
jgi:hypothetical protein